MTRRVRCFCGSLHAEKAHGPRCTAVDRRWPLDALVAVVGADALARDRSGITADRVALAKREGLTDRQADTWAVRLGQHPGLVWDQWFEAALTPLDDLFVNAGGWRPAWEFAEGREADPLGLHVGRVARPSVENVA